MAFRSLFDGAKKLAINGGGGSTASLDTIFTKTEPKADGDDCLQDCDSCTVRYPRGFKINTSDTLYGMVKGWSTHMLVATGKTDWVRDIADEKGSVMQAVDRASAPTNGKLMLSASNIPTPSQTTSYDEPTRVVLLPAFVTVDNVTPANVPELLANYVSTGPTNKAPLAPVTFASLAGAQADASSLTVAPCPHSALVLLCSQKTRDARCGQSAPLIRKELERHLRPLGLFRDYDDERPGGVGVYFISHVGGHKYSANMMVYRRPDAFGLDNVQRGQLTAEELADLPARVRKVTPAVLRKGTTATTANGNGNANGNGEAKTENGETAEGDSADAPVGASQCIWLARVLPEDCENIVKYTILQGKVVKPETQLRAGFDRERGVLSW